MEPICNTPDVQIQRSCPSLKGLALSICHVTASALGFMNKTYEKRTHADNSVHRSCVSPLENCVQSCQSTLTGWMERQEGGESCVPLGKDRQPERPPTPTLLSFPHLSTSFPLPSASLPSHPLPIPLSRVGGGGGQLTATSLGGPEASWPCSRALLDCSLTRMDKDSDSLP